MASESSVASPSPLYRTIVADPPWRYRVSAGITTRTSHGTACAEDNYPTMTNAEIMALPVRDLAADNAHLYVWVTNPKLYGDKDRITPRDIVEAWGFQYITLLTWIKKPGALGMGFYFRGETEHVVFAKRGDAPIPTSQREVNWFFAAKRRHSEKPDSFMDMVERVSPAPRLEMFSRRARLGWDTWGNEALHGTEAVA
jgi:N6-adenosine-specific RNA methylase IME4